MLGLLGTVNMGNLTSGDIAILCAQALTLAANVYMKYDKHILFSSCCQGRCCMLTNETVMADNKSG